MYMVDKEKEVINEFGYTNQDGGIESVRYDEEESLVIIDFGWDSGHNVYPKDVHNLIKALQYMQKYLVDKGVIEE